MKRAALILVALSFGAVSAEARQCTLEKAVYRSAEPNTDYELTFAAGDLGGVTQRKIELNSKTFNIQLTGLVSWTNGFARPMASLGPSSTNEGIYENEIVALSLDLKWRIMKIEFSATADPAPQAILLHQITRSIYYWGLELPGFDLTERNYLPGDMFWLVGCDP